MSYPPECSHRKPQGSNLRLLCLSNGHGEDIIAVRILQELQQRSTSFNIAALPLVGEGRAYTQVGIPLIGSVKTMPSGGFIYMDGRQLMRDLKGGLLQLTLAQLGVIKSWARGEGDYSGQGDKETRGQGDKETRKGLSPCPPIAPSPCPPFTREGSLVLAVGDIVPLLFAWLSGANYAFVGTAKSEYYVRDENGNLPERSPFTRLENWSGSVYHPWERWLMSHPRCKAVFPRDSFTTQTLQKSSIPAFDLGNPMMDNLEPVTALDISDSQKRRSLTILLLAGSRPPEAYNNWQQMIAAAEGLMATFSDRDLIFLAAIAPSLNLKPLCQILVNAGFVGVGSPEIPGVEQTIHLNPPLQESRFQNRLTFKRKNASVILTQHAYNECLHIAEVAIAMAGTATEQFVGLSKPAITFPGNGPQFTYTFAEAQSRHLGASIILVENPQQVADAVQSLLNDPERLKLIAENGLRRMGKPGAAKRIAQCLIEIITPPC
jgi:uncharacterized protein (TIGR03492 family)